MKILAIRGKNLASLAGEFEVDFTVAIRRLLKVTVVLFCVEEQPRDMPKWTS